MSVQRLDPAAFRQSTVQYFSIFRSNNFKCRRHERHLDRRGLDRRGGGELASAKGQHFIYFCFRVPRVGKAPRISKIVCELRTLECSGTLARLPRNLNSLCDNCFWGDVSLFNQDPVEWTKEEVSKRFLVVLSSSWQVNDLLRS